MDAPRLRYDYAHPLLDRERLQQMDWQSPEPLWLDTTPARPRLSLLLQQYRQVPGTQVMTPAWDRLGDSLTAIHQVQHTCQQAGITLIVAQGNQLDWAQVNQLRKYLQKRAIQLGHLQAQQQQRPPAGRVPYGYQWGETGYIPDPQTAPGVRAFFEHFLLYGSVQAAVEFLAEHYHKSITPTTAIRWLTAPVYRGHTQSKYQPLQRDTHPALLSPEAAAQIDRIRQRNRRVSHRSAGAPHALAGMVRCAQCQGSWRVNSVSRKYQQYQHNTYRYLTPSRCPQRPPCPGIAYDPLWRSVLAHLCPQLMQWFAQPLPLGGMKQTLQQQIQHKQQALARLDDLKRQEILDELTVQMRTMTLQTELNQLQNQLAQLPPVNLQEIAQTASLPEFWFDLSPVEQRLYLREFLDHIEVAFEPPQYRVRLIFNLPLPTQPEFCFEPARFNSG
ncbi:MAG: recombinase family protein [Gloeomargarita sp. DG_2_bins_126]